MSFYEQTPAKVHVAENNLLKIGVIGCGSRGRGATANVMKMDAHSQVVAIGDALRERAEPTAKFLQEEFGDRVQLDDDSVFCGLDAYKKVIERSDVVLLCETPHFRPISLRAAVEAGKHVFCEKPVAVDAPGVRSVLESARIAKEKNLNVVSGLCFRYDPDINDMIDRIHAGQIGEPLSVHQTFLTNKVWTRPREPNDTEMMSQLRNWYNFNWLSGDFLVEQAVHGVDKAMWVFRDEVPVSAYGIGGQMMRTDRFASSDIYDYMSVVYEYADGRTIHSFCNQMNNVFADREEYVTGTKGFARLMEGIITGSNPYKQNKVNGNRYDLEQQALFRAIRSGETINNGDYMVKSTLLAILGREACYSGRKITWEEMFNSDDSLAPTAYSFDADPPNVPDSRGRYKIPLPGTGFGFHEIVNT